MSHGYAIMIKKVGMAAPAFLYRGVILTIKLQKNDEEIVKAFRAMTTIEDIANLLEINKEQLWKNVINNKSYTSFKIPKKNSSLFREINKPSQNLDIIQKKLNYALSLAYDKTHNSAHGFLANKSIKTNAMQHINKKIILNIDLEDFFGTINFARVRAMFITYYKFNNGVATILANICCDNHNKLAQGAATSPLISNIIANKLDKQLFKLAKSSKSNYTRYADDITFSTNLNELSKNILLDEINLELGKSLENTVLSNGFKINSSKTRISRSNKAQYVTGIKVNEKLNVNRKYIKKIRTIINNIEKNIDDLEKAREIFHREHNHRGTLFKDYDMVNVLRGMISHVGFIKGKKDQVFQSYAKRYNTLMKQVNTIEDKYSYIKIPLTSTQFREKNIYVIESDTFGEYIMGSTKMNDLDVNQGTAFMLKGIGLITNYHVIKPYVEKVIEWDFAKFEYEYYIFLSKSRYESNLWMARVAAFDKERDIAILEIEGIDNSSVGFNYSLDIRPGMSCTVLGYPEYKDGQYLHEMTGRVQSARANVLTPNEQYLRYTVDIPILGGNSGGPIVNDNNEVVAIAVKGKDYTVSEIIPIVELIQTRDNNGLIEVINQNIRT